MANTIDLAAQWDEQMVVSSDGRPKDWFGSGVTVLGSTAFVSAKNASINGKASQGAVYVFKKVGSQWKQAQKLVANDGSAGDQFGTALFLSTRFAVITAPIAKVGNNRWQGAAYVFAQVDGKWVQANKLVATGGGAFETFGNAVAANADTIFISSGGALHLGSHMPRRVHVFSDASRRDDGTLSWEEKQIIESPIPEDATSSFGSSLAISQGILLIGARASTVNGNPGQGTVFAYSKRRGNWSQTAKLVAKDGAARDNFGLSIAFEGRVALIGAPGFTVNGNVSQGAVYQFENSNGSWFQKDQYTTPTDGALKQFGASVGLTAVGNAAGSSQAVIGAYGEDSYRGAAYVFSKPLGRQTQVFRLQAANSLAGDVFGYNTAIDGNTILIGSFTATVNGNDEQGAVYFLHRRPIAEDVKTRSFIPRDLPR